MGWYSNCLNRLCILLGWVDLVLVVRVFSVGAGGWPGCISVARSADSLLLNTEAQLGGGRRSGRPPLDGQGGGDAPPLILAISYIGRSPINPSIAPILGDLNSKVKDTN